MDQLTANDLSKLQTVTVDNWSVSVITSTEYDGAKLSVSAVTYPSGQVGFGRMDFEPCPVCDKASFATSKDAWFQAFRHGHIRLWFPKNPALETWRSYGESWKVTRQVSRIKSSAKAL